MLSCYSGRAEGRHLTFMIVLICLGSLHHVARSCSQKGVSRSSPAVRGYDEDSDGHSMARHVLLIGCDGLGKFLFLFHLFYFFKLLSFRHHTQFALHEK